MSLRCFMVHTRESAGRRHKTGGGMGIHGMARGFFSFSTLTSTHPIFFSSFLEGLSTLVRLRPTWYPYHALLLGSDQR